MIKIEVVDENGTLHYYPEDAHRALVAVGLIWRAADRWRQAGPDAIDLGILPELAVCDFCSQRPVAWEAMTDSFSLLMVAFPTKGATTFTSTQGWVACEPCGALIVAGKRHALLRRAIANTVHQPGPITQPIIDALRELHAGFWRCYRSIRRLETSYANPQP